MTEILIISLSDYPNTQVTPVSLSDFPKYPGYKRYDVSNILFNLSAEMHSFRYLIKVVSDIPKLSYCGSFIRGQQNCRLLIHRCAVNILCRSQTALAGARLEIYHIDRTEHHLYRMALFLVVRKLRSASLILGGFFHIIIRFKLPEVALQGVLRYSKHNLATQFPPPISRQPIDS